MNAPLNMALYDLQPSFPLIADTPPPALRRLSQSIELGRLVAPALARRLLWKLWFTPQRTTPNQRARGLMASVEHRFEVYSGDEGVVVSSWGQGPKVLLAHGWSTYGAQLGSLVTPLVKSGHQVLLFDAPGHAGNPKRQFRLDQYAQLLHDIILHTGGVHAVVGHSIGATASAIALHRLNLYARYVAIAPSANLKTVLQGFQHRLGLSDASMALLHGDLLAFFGPDLWRDYSLDHHLPELLGPALLVHDRDDKEAPLANTHYLKSLRPDADTFFTSNLGHNRVLYDNDVVARASAFISAPHLLRRHG